MWQTGSVVTQLSSSWAKSRLVYTLLHITRYIHIWTILAVLSKHRLEVTEMIIATGSKCVPNVYSVAEE